MSAVAPTAEQQIPPGLILQGARLLADPGTGTIDIAVADGRITAIAPHVTAEGARILDVSGPDVYVLPGLIDFHVHVAKAVAVKGMTLQSAAPDMAGVTAGVTTVVDAGSLGHPRFEDFAQDVIPPARTRVLAMLNVSSNPHTVADGGDIRSLDDIDRAAIERVVEDHADAIVALKLRLVGGFAEHNGERLVREALEVAQAVERPLVVHIGDRYSDRNPTVIEHFAAGVRAVLNLLRTGDAISHVCSPWPGALMGTGKLETERLRAARERGVLFDVASGRNHFSADVARRLLAEGLAPQILSTDMNGPGIEHHSLVEAMSKFLALGYPLQDVLAMVTGAPAAAIGREREIGSLAVGRGADITVLRLVDAELSYEDSVGTHYAGSKGFVPLLTVKDGRVIDAREGPHNRQWLSAQVGPEES